MRSICLLLLYRAILTLTCPTDPTTPPSTWRISFNISRQTIYMEQVNNDSGYYVFNNVDIAGNNMTIGIHWLEGSGSGLMYPSPEVLGLQSDANTNITGSQITYSGPDLFVQGVQCDQTNIRSFNFTPLTRFACTGLYGGSIFDICPNDFYIVSSASCQSYSCYPCDCGCPSSCYGPGIGLCCHAACVSCFGPTSDTCVSCNSGYYLQPSPSITTCLSTCPSGYYGDNSTHACVSCNLACATCTNSNKNSCISCRSGYYLQPSPLVTTCLSTCPSGYYGDNSTQACVSCDRACATCTSSNQNSCISCRSGYYLQPSPLVTTCLSTCPSGYYGDNSTQACVSCNLACATCTNSNQNSCISCSSGYYLQPSPLVTTCLSACPSGYRANNSMYSCQLNADPLDSSSFSDSLLAADIALIGSNAINGMFFLNLILCLSAIDSIANMQYLNINHSEIALKAYTGLSGSLLPNLIARLNTLDQQQLVFNYGVFEKSQVSSLYLDNYGDSLLEVVIIYLTLYLLALFLAGFRKKEDLIHSRTGEAYSSAFGLLLSNILGGLQKQLLFSSIQILKINLLTDAYSGISYLSAYLTMTSVVSLHIFCFVKLQNIFAANKKRADKREPRSRIDDSTESALAAEIDERWTRKKYEKLFNAFKDDTENRFLFSYWVTAYNAAYVCVILTLQSVPVIQCLSLVVLVIVFLLFSVIVNPLKEKSATFVYFFNFICVLVVGIINMAVSIEESLTLQASTNNQLGWTIFIMVAINTGGNILIGLSKILLQICKKFKKTAESDRSRGVSLERISAASIDQRDGLNSSIAGLANASSNNNFSTTSGKKQNYSTQNLVSRVEPKSSTHQLDDSKHSNIQIFRIGKKRKRMRTSAKSNTFISELK